MELYDILSVLPVYETEDEIKNIKINKVHMDHRHISEGDLFLCIKGFTVDGHDFAQGAVENGASIIVSEKPLSIETVPVILVPDTTRALALIANKFYDYPSRKIDLVGITGTNGKTTTTYLLEEIFREAEKNTGLIGTIQLKIKDETKPLKNTTPDALQLQTYFAEMVEAKVDIAFMEVSSHALDLGRVYGTEFDIALFTNLSQDHLDYHETMEEYLEAKSLLFSGLGNSYTDRPKFAIVNADDPASEVIKKKTMQPIITYGIKKKSDIQASQIENSLTGTSFIVTTPRGEIEINSHLNGIFNVYNMLAAIAVAYVRKVPLTRIKQALEKVRGVDGRFERVDCGQDFAVIVDYAHTPDSLENVLKTIKQFAEGKIFTVVGSGGDRDRTKRPLMAEAALKYSDYTIFTSDNPRTEDPAAILQDMTRSLDQDHYEVIEERREAIFRAVQLAGQGDVILIAGKGHETYQEIDGVRYDFDDRLVAKEAIWEKGMH